MPGGPEELEDRPGLGLRSRWPQAGLHRYQEALSESRHEGIRRGHGSCVCLQSQGESPSKAETHAGHEDPLPASESAGAGQAHQEEQGPAGRGSCGAAGCSVGSEARPERGQPGTAPLIWQRFPKCGTASRGHLPSPPLSLSRAPSLRLGQGWHTPGRASSVSCEVADPPGTAKKKPQARVLPEQRERLEMLPAGGRGHLGDTSLALGCCCLESASPRRLGAGLWGWSLVPREGPDGHIHIPAAARVEPGCPGREGVASPAPAQACPLWKS